jgi:hypothetical protein
VASSVCQALGIGDKEGSNKGGVTHNGDDGGDASNEVHLDDGSEGESGFRMPSSSDGGESGYDGGRDSWILLATSSNAF